MYLYINNTKDSGDEKGMDDCWVEDFMAGTITSCPVKFQTWNILNSISIASDPNVPRPRWDNTGYVYSDRSFGVGSAAGLNDTIIHPFNATYSLGYYTFYETGYNTTARCTFNETSDLRLKTIQMQDKDHEAMPNLYLSIGALPNANWTYINEHENDDEAGRAHWAQTSFNTNETIVSTFQKASIDSENKKKYMFGIVTGTQYEWLDTVQCELFFEPTRFLVNVSVTDSYVEVTKDESGEFVEDIDPTGNLRERAMLSYHISLVLLSLYESPLGNAFIQNENLFMRYNGLTESTDESVLRSMENALQAVMDDTLVALGAASLFSDKGKEADAMMSVSAVQIGSGRWIWVAFFLNMIGLLGVLIVCCMLWGAEIPVFDYNDLGCLAVGVSNGSSIRTPEMGMREKWWDGHPGSDSIAHLSAKLEISQSNRQPVIILG